MPDETSPDPVSNKPDPDPRNKFVYLGLGLSIAMPFAQYIWPTLPRYVKFPGFGLGVALILVPLWPALVRFYRQQRHVLPALASGVLISIAWPAFVINVLIPAAQTASSPSGLHNMAIALQLAEPVREEATTGQNFYLDIFKNNPPLRASDIIQKFNDKPLSVAGYLASESQTEHNIIVVLNASHGIIACVFSMKDSTAIRKMNLGDPFHAVGYINNADRSDFLTLRDGE